MAHILIADDAPDIATMFALMLRSEGHEVVPVTSGDEAVRKYQEAREASSPFDLVVLDLAMPGMNGFDAATQIREIDPEARVAFLTAFDEPMSVNRASRIDAPIWEKPIEQEELAARVAEMVGK